MDKLISAGKEFLEQHSQDQSSSQAHGSGSLAPAHEAGATPFGADDDETGAIEPGERTHDDDDDLGKAPLEASRLAGSSGSSDLFSKAMSMLGQRKAQIADEDIDEEDARRKHKQTYSDDSHGDENSLGVAATTQALKMFNSQGHSGSGSGSGQGAFLAMAMAEASKLFDDKASKGKVPSDASKESVIQKAGETAMKMYFKSQAQQKGGLMGLASQFIK